ncbi:MAG: trypsin-like peptidase domain-containing protein [Anaerolineae bacterium]|nr:trypsin-like peptidase domain-containing protein [Anaerolineae bacterium]
MRRKTYLAILSLIVFSLGCVGLRGFQPPEIASTPQPTSTIPLQETLSPPIVVAENPVLSDLETQVEAVYVAASRSVVNIAVTTIAYDYFFNPVPQEGSGSGFVYDQSGHIITNYHVIEDAEDIQVTFSDGATFFAEVIGADPTYDLAALRITADNYPLTPVSLGDSNELRVGQFVIAIGSPFGLEQTLTFGVISSLGRIIESPDQRYIGEAIQTDAAINPGNSGGPLLDIEGRVIGVNAQIISPSRASAGIGFAIPVDTVRRVVPQLISNGSYRHSWMGIRFLPVGLNAQIAEEFASLGFEVPDAGLLVTVVENGSPADVAGMQGATREVSTKYGQINLGGDVILEIDGQPILSGADLIAYLETNTSPGDEVEIVISRDMKEQTLFLVLGERP